MTARVTLAAAAVLRDRPSALQRIVDFWHWPWGLDLVAGLLLVVYLAIFAATVGRLQRDRDPPVVRVAD